MKNKEKNLNFFESPFLIKNNRGVNMNLQESKHHHFETSESKEIQLNELFKVIKRRLLLIIFSTLLLTTAMGIYNYYTYDPLYQATTRILVKAPPDLMETLLVMMDEPIILNKVVSDLNLPYSSDLVSNKVSVGRIDGSQVINVKVIDSNPILAAKIANSTTQAYTTEIPKLMDFNDFDILSKANEQSYSPPINNNLNRNILIAFVISLFLSIGFVFILNSIDETLKSEKQIESILNSPVIGTIRRVKPKKVKGQQKTHTKVEIRGESTIGS
jgi:capsular polysaccharide biosynthesis protein